MFVKHSVVVHIPDAAHTESFAVLYGNTRSWKDFSWHTQHVSLVPVSAVPARKASWHILFVPQISAAGVDDVIVKHNSVTVRVNIIAQLNKTKTKIYSLVFGSTSVTDIFNPPQATA